MKIQSPWMGRIKGSAGNMTGCKVYDKNVMRAKAFEVSNPNTQAQQTQRNYFASLINLIGTFTEEQLRTLFPQKPKAMSRRNALTKQLSESNNTDGTIKSIDFADITTLGNAQTMDFGNTDAMLDTTTIRIELAASVIENQNYSANLFIAAVINETKGEIILSTTNASVGTGILEIARPANWANGDNIHAIPLITNVKTPKTLGGFGSFSIMVRPEK